MDTEQLQSARIKCADIHREILADETLKVNDPERLKTYHTEAIRAIEAGEWDNTLLIAQKMHFYLTGEDSC